MNYPPVLEKIDQMTEVDADHAMQMIDSIGIEMAHASEPVQMYYKLLTVKVQEKIDVSDVPYVSFRFLIWILCSYK